MSKKFKGIQGLIVFFCFIMMLSLALPGQTVPKKDGYVLLDDLKQIIQEASKSGRWEVEKIYQLLRDSMTEARQLREQKQIDGPFFVRYQRLLQIMKMTAAPDPDLIMKPIINREVENFINEVLGEEVKASQPEAILLLGLAFRDEIINLRIYLDNREKKEKLIKEWNEKMSWIEEKK
ncbi:MAG: hypothetical protein H5U05_08965 [Candidatus Aminicenantes bacterium]|nr:hypothetical protein [Candidatus Aminicenantes bacterium]